MSDPSPLLDRAGSEDAFGRLGDRLVRRGVVADLYVFGGAAMALAYDSRRATRDVDALFKPHHCGMNEPMACRTTWSYCVSVGDLDTGARRRRWHGG